MYTAMRQSFVVILQPKNNPFQKGPFAVDEFD